MVRALRSLSRLARLSALEFKDWSRERRLLWAVQVP